MRYRTGLVFLVLLPLLAVAASAGSNISDSSNLSGLSNVSGVPAETGTPGADAVSDISPTYPWVVVENTSSVEFWETVSPGQTVSGHFFLGFHEDFILGQNLTFTTDLEDATWNYSLYFKQPSTYSVDWYPQPKVSGTTLVITSTNDTTLFHDAVKVDVKGKVPNGVNGSEVVIEKVVRYDNLSGKALDSITTAATLSNGTLTPATTAPDTTAGSASASASPSSPATRKSPLGLLPAISALALCAAFVLARDRIRN